MDIRIIEYKNLNEKIYVYEHKSGLSAFVVPKKGYSKKFATYATNYGSVNSEFIIPGENNITRVPEGIAHFLEHKLFDQEDGSIMDKFSELGADPNAYTGFNQTVYLFSCTDRFNENFNLLLRFVQNPYLTDESIEKERGIIGQEIKMYQDHPDWRVFFNYLGALYHNMPGKIDIAGAIESISKIDKKTLLTCYNTFYHPSNMIILVVGDVDPDDIFNKVESSIKTKESRSEIKRIFPQEPETVNEKYVELSMPVSTPQFQMGFKDKAGFRGKALLEREVAVDMLLEMIVGKSSELYDSLYNEGLINSTFSFDYMIEEDYAHSIIGGESKDPIKVRDRIAAQIENIKAKGLDRSVFERIKRSKYGRFLRQLNSVENISYFFISVYFKGAYVFDYAQIYDKITFEYVNEVFNDHFDLEKLALSVVKPV